MHSDQRCSGCAALGLVCRATKNQSCDNCKSNQLGCSLVPRNKETEPSSNGAQNKLKRARSEEESIDRRENEKKTGVDSDDEPLRKRKKCVIFLSISRPIT